MTITTTQQLQTECTRSAQFGTSGEQRRATLLLNPNWSLVLECHRTLRWRPGYPAFSLYFSNSSRKPMMNCSWTSLISSIVGWGFLSTSIGLPTTTCIGLGKGKGVLHSNVRGHVKFANSKITISESNQKCTY